MANNSNKKTQKSAGSKSKSRGLLEKFFIDQLKDIYYAEKALLKAMPKMQKNATSQELVNAFTTHLEQTKGQVSRLEEVFGMMGLSPSAKKCEAMVGLIEEGESIMEETEDDTWTRDVALIVAAQKIEHYEISSYGSLKQLANTMGMTDVAKLLDETLKEEKETDMLLTNIAETGINEEAEVEE